MSGINSSHSIRLYQFMGSSNGTIPSGTVLKSSAKRCFSYISKLALPGKMVTSDRSSNRNSLSMKFNGAKINITF